VSMTCERYVDAAPVREHLDRLVTAGATVVAIAELTGLTRTTLSDILRQRRARVYTYTERVIVAVAVGEVTRGSRVGLMRRVRALQAIGWSQRAIADAAGVSQPTICYLAGGRWVTTSPSLDQQVRGAYQRLHMTPGPSQVCRELARRRRWAPPG